MVVVMAGRGRGWGIAAAVAVHYISSSLSAHDE